MLRLERKTAPGRSTPNAPRFQKRRWKFLPVVILLAQIFFVGWLGMRTTLSWDGLFNWEMKAKVFYEQGGIPKRLLQSEALAWAHVDYPP